MAKPMKMWFREHGMNGDRTLEQQMQGLDLLKQSVKGKTVLDIGCAEGLIDFELIRDGAVAIHGVEYRHAAVTVANTLRQFMPCTFEQGDANIWAPKRPYNIVLLLAVLHKLKDPVAACARFIEAASEMVVIRLPPHHLNPCVLDARSGLTLHLLGDTIKAAGFKTQHVECGYLGEWIGYYTRA